jgi:hypothetical protein
MQMDMKRVYYLVILLAVISCAPKEKSKSGSEGGDSAKGGATITTPILKSNPEGAKDCGLRSDIEIPRDIGSFISQNVPDMRLARLRDFAQDWCHFYEEDHVPYFTEGNFDDDEFIEKAVILTDEERSKISIAIIDLRKDHQFSMIQLESMEEKAADPQTSKFTFGLFTRQPGEAYDFETDTTFTIARPYVTVTYFKKAAVSYYWTADGYKRIHTGD